jgi:putative transposase
LAKKGKKEPCDYWVKKVPMPYLSNSDFQKLIALRQDAAWIWNSLILMHREARYGNRPYFSTMDLASQMTGYTTQLGLHLTTQSQNLIFQEFLGVCETTRTNRGDAVQAGQLEAWRSHKYPFRERQARDTHFDRREAQNLRGGFTLGMAMEPNPKKPGKMRRRAPLFIPYAQGIPSNTTAITIHYGWQRKEFEIIFKIKKKKAITAQDKPAGARYAAIDLGQIRWAVVMTENGKSLNLKGKGFRSIHRDFNKKLAFRQKRIAKKKKGSNNRKKEVLKKAQVQKKYQRRKENFLHTNSRKLINFLAKHDSTHVFVGDCRSLPCKDSGSRQNQANSGWPIGEFYKKVEYKGGWEGISVEWKSERNSTRQCPDPHCKQHNRIKGRVYRCSRCGINAHRDAVGSWNILSFSMETCGLKVPIFKSDYVAINKQKYLAPVSMKFMSGKFLRRSSKKPQVASSAGQPRSAEYCRSMAPREPISTVISTSYRETVRVEDMDQTPRAGYVREKPNSEKVLGL